MDTQDQQTSLPRVVILGATGHIGASAVSIMRKHARHFRLTALIAYKNTSLLAKLCAELTPAKAGLLHTKKCAELHSLLKNTSPSPEIICGEEAVNELVGGDECDIVIIGIAGTAGLRPTLAAIRGGKRVLLASKEVLVTAGSVITTEVKRHAAQIIPLDSEHNAALQCLPNNWLSAANNNLDSRKYVKNITLTASGGPFLNMPRNALRDVSPEQACDHPNWKMGQKISVDSATMMNKGLEIIEARWLFGLPSANIDAVIHRQSIIHALVTYCDGTSIAQMSMPDMRIALASAILWPRRLDSGIEPINFSKTPLHLDFQPISMEAFPCYRIAREVMLEHELLATVLNAANDTAVDLFLQKRIRFTDIEAVITTSLDHFGNKITSYSKHPALEDILHLHDEATQYTLGKNK